MTTHAYAATVGHLPRSIRTTSGRGDTCRFLASLAAFHNKARMDDDTAAATMIRNPSFSSHAVPNPLAMMG